MQKYYRYINILLSAVCITLSSMTVSAQPVQMDTQVMRLQIEKIDQAISKTKLNYEQLTLIFSQINALQPKIDDCIQSGQARLKKIQQVLHVMKLSNTIKPDAQPYAYLTNEKNDKLTQITYCNFFNYRLGEIRDLATNKIDNVRKSDLFLKTAFWQGFTPDILSHIDISSTAVYQQVMSSPTIILLSKAIVMYLLLVLASKIALNRSLTEKPWPNAMTIFQIALFFLSAVYTIYIQVLLHKYHALPLYLADYQLLIYIIVVARLVICIQEHGKQWLSPSIATLLQQRLTIIATIILLAYILYKILSTQVVPVQFLLFLETVLICLLNIAYVWLILAFLNAESVVRRFSAFNLKTIKIILTSICLCSLVLAWSGYLHLAFFLIPNLVLSLMLIIILFEYNQFIVRCYFLLSNASQIPSKKLRFILGIKTEKTLVELYVLRITAILPALVIGALCLCTLWGLTRYQIVNIFLNLQHGFTFFGATFQPVKIIRAINFFCYIILLGRTLATYLVRHKLAKEEIHTQNTMLLLVQYLSFSIGLLLALYILNVDLQGLIVVTGALSIGLGFGLQNFAKDFISGLVIMVNKPVQIGDHVVITDNRSVYDGFITKIGALSTQLHTLSHSDVFIPNSYIISKSITNFTFHSNRLSRVNITIEVNKEQNIERIKQLLLDIAAKNSGVIQEPPNQPTVLFDLGEMNLWFVVNDVNKKEMIMSELNFAITNAMKKLDIDFQANGYRNYKHPIPHFSKIP